MILSAEEFQEQVGACLSSHLADEMLMAFNTKYYLACQKIDEVQHIYNSMRHFLWNAVKPDTLYHDAKIVDPLSILWHRHLNWQTAALWLNQCGDYLLQVVWLGFGLHQYDKITAKTYKKALEGCTRNKTMQVLKEKDSKIILPILEEYFLGSREVHGWVNQLKHRGNIECEEIEKILRNRCFSVKINYGDGQSVCEDDLMPELVSIEYAVSTLISTLNSFKKAFNQLVEYFSPDNFFSKNEEGAIIVTEPLKNPPI
ncbi:MAG: hypothetical protein ABFD50_13525 [Smithella sp.]